MKELRRFGDQHYEKLRKGCLKSGHLFVDTLFPPTNGSLFLEEGRSSDIVWKRPAELHEDPHLFVEGASANDVTQGILGNCWFVSACSALTHNQTLLDRVIPYGNAQEWSPKNRYAGIFRFRFWRFGVWVEVVIDDLLPTRDGKLLFARSKTPNEFWSALLEKAFAKLYGCYENLVGGHLSDALQDVSSGVAETLNVKKFLKEDIQDKSGRLYDNLKTAFDNGALIVAAIAARTKEEIEESLDCGLVKGHAYAVSAVLSIDLNRIPNRSSIRSLLLGSKEKQKLIRLQNPWGEKEWNGEWSDNSSEWLNVSDEKKLELNVTVDEDGDFWMPWESFVYYFTDISLCQLFNTNIFSLSKRYHEEVVHDEWTTHGKKSGAPDDRAGGCLNFPATFCNNPQYSFDVPMDDCEIMFALTQREVSEGMKKREPYVTIGMHLMRVENNRVHRVHQAMQAVGTSEYANARSVFLHLRSLAAGRYVLMPTTYAPREQTNFLLRMYSDQKVRLTPLTKHSPKLGLFGCKSAQSVTRITIHGAALDLATDGVRAYAVLICNGKEVSNGDFFAVEISHVWEDRQMARDHLIGRAPIVALIDNENRQSKYELLDDSRRTTASVDVTVSAFDDPMYL
ncbi:unnamed protein product [Caenorhabditis auriculariae]|uniref:Calpain catalytic domain-containing protein n=1 Tax=Caenorhabditis auriculariae TaxID=2777116 RepID=A0A8S1H709_9PELO|nr:unnamed protein product [Caenorhabditis auriculariae]